MSSNLDNVTIVKAYARWAPVYDLVFGPVFEQGRRAAIAAADRIGGRILEVGVGTGISLPDYDQKHRIVGIDLSEPMLRKAGERAATDRIRNLDGLVVMDAQRLGFEAGTFDVVIALYVITVVPDPEATLDEFARVLRPGGEIILINHIGAEAGLRRVLEQWFAPIARRLGWRPGFQWDRLSRWAELHQEVGLIERRIMPPLGHFSLIRFLKQEAAPGTAAFVPPQLENNGRWRNLGTPKGNELASQPGMRAGQGHNRVSPMSNGEGGISVARAREHPNRLAGLRRRDKSR
jgi:phosphatidylethanolamine/phosphatidyl-N-methylethanolamine N-methyltransferase